MEGLQTNHQPDQINPANTEFKMANFSSTGASAPGKSCSQTFSVDSTPAIVDGLVLHPDVSPATQIQILSIVDETGSASVGDIVSELARHDNAVPAILGLVAAEVLALDINGVLDANTMVSRLAISAARTGSGDNDLPPETPSSPLPPSMEKLGASPFAPQLYVTAGEDRRDFLRSPELRRPGVYILMSDVSGYVGFGSDVGHRVANGQQRIENIDKVIALVDQNNALTADDARAVERVLWSRMAAAGERQLINGVPDGAAVDPARYSTLEVFVAQACLTLRQNGLLFTTVSARSILAGPRAEPERIGENRRGDETPSGAIHELNFSDGLVARAARQSEHHWLLLSGSEIRLTAVASAGGPASFLRAAWAHSGLLGLREDGRCYTTRRDIVFASGSAAAHFCAGAKGHGTWAWRAVKAADAFDPEMATLTAA
jgi:hypothetical protein